MGSWNSGEQTINPPLCPRPRINLFEIQTPRETCTRCFPGVTIDPEFEAQRVDLVCKPFDAVGELCGVGDDGEGFGVARVRDGPAVVDWGFSLVCRPGGGLGGQGEGGPTVNINISQFLQPIGNQLFCGVKNPRFVNVATICLASLDLIPSIRSPHIVSSRVYLQLTFHEFQPITGVRPYSFISYPRIIDHRPSSPRITYTEKGTHRNTILRNLRLDPCPHPQSHHNHHHSSVPSHTSNSNHGKGRGKLEETTF